MDGELRESLDLDAFLEGLATEGHKDSSGVFTLDPVEAQRKLRKYQFHHPYAFVGAFMASAALGGATSVHLHVNPQQLRISWSSPWLSGEQLERLFTYLLDGKGPAYLRELALGVNSALALKPARLQLSSGDLRQHFTPARQWQSQAEEAIAGLCLELDYSRPHRLKRSLPGELPEIQLVKRSCALAAPFIEINEQRLQPHIPVGQCLITAVLEGGRSSAVQRLRASLPASPIQLTFPGVGRHCGAFAVYRDQPEWVGLVVDGLTFPLPLLQLPGAWGLVIAPQLKRDLSAFALVDNDDYQEMTTVVRDIFRAILEYFCTGWEQFELEQRRASALVVNHYAVQKVIAEDVFAAHALFAKVVRLYEDFELKFDMTYFEAAYAIWLLNQRESLDTDDYHVREYFRAFAEKVESSLNLGLERLSVGQTRGTFRVGSARNGGVCEQFLEMVSGMDRLILGETHPFAQFHESRASRPGNIHNLLKSMPRPLSSGPRHWR